MSDAITTRGAILDAAIRLPDLREGGYEAVDFPSVKAILGTPEPTDRQVRALWLILRKYRDTLSRGGIDYDRFVPPNGIAQPAAPPFDVPTKLELRPFQKEGIRFVEGKNGRALICDEPGVGKTPQALGYLVRNRESLPAIVVCPAFIRMVWVEQAKKFTDLKVLLIASKTSLKAFQKLGVPTALFPEPGYDLVVLNYDLLDAETPAVWARAILAGDLAPVPYLLAAGHYAIKPINKILRATQDEEGKARLQGVLKQIGAQGKKANKKRFVKAFVNGRPLEELARYGFRTLIGDELHYCKDMKAQRTLAVEELSKSVANVIGLTGTPVVNKPLELYSQVRIVNPYVFPDFMKFGQRYCAAQQRAIQIKGAKRGETQDVWDFSGASHLEELNTVLRANVMIRRMKAEVLSELPAKIRMTIPLALENKITEAYRKETAPFVTKLRAMKAESDAWKASLVGLSPADRTKFLADHAREALGKNKLTGAMLAELEKVKQAAVRAKYDQALSFILNAHEQEGKVLVFVAHHETTDRLVADLGEENVKVDWIDGRIKGPKREPIKNRFQEGDLEILVCGIRAASEGLTLTASHTVVVVEYDYNPARHDQAEGRVDRFGQTVPPTIYYLIALGTVEEKLVAMIEAKREVVHAALGESDRTLEEEGILDALVENVLERAG